ncbi:MAG: hypothetical protein CL927_05765 [Deltaproteobacteria bacterium]|nr:hypothetical protein [Deltaproteobacteria bacterium]HCH62479.1 hypothetical protein [Deltaproteobacteria bacterium]
MSIAPHARPPASWPLAELPAHTLAQARKRFSTDNGFGVDGGYDAPFQDAELAGIPYRTPNPPARGAVLQRHDLHHVLTGYPTDWRGEAFISAWELGSGGPSGMLFAWTIVLFGIFTGIVGDPVGTFRAFVRGCGSDNLYGTSVDDALMQRSVSGLGQSLRVRAELPRDQIWHPAVTRRERAQQLMTFAIWAATASAYVAFASPAVVVLAVGGMLARVRERSAACCVLQACAS